MVVWDIEISPRRTHRQDVRAGKNWINPSRIDCNNRAFPTPKNKREGLLVAHRRTTPNEANDANAVTPPAVRQMEIADGHDEMITEKYGIFYRDRRLAR